MVEPEQRAMAERLAELELQALVELQVALELLAVKRQRAPLPWA